MSRGRRAAIVFLGLLFAGRLNASEPSLNHSPAPLRAHGPDEEVLTGFVFRDGVYLPPPYVVRGRDGVLLAGGLPIAAPWNPAARRAGRPGDQLKGLLRAEAVFIADSDRPLLVLPPRTAGVALLRLLVPGHDRNAAASDLLRGATPEVRAGLWGEWLLKFEPSPEFLERAGRRLEVENKLEQAQANRRAARQRLAMAEFPLSLVALLLTAVAAAHLLQNVPQKSAEGAGFNFSPGLARVFKRTLLLVGLLAALDAVWTVLAAQSGQMRELNPFAAPLLGRPAALLAFKAVLTFAAVGLLFALRRHRAAHLAAWWVCFVTAAVAVRWVLFSTNS